MVMHILNMFIKNVCKNDVSWDTTVCIVAGDGLESESW
jgi:hypothetical protein